MKTIKQKEKEMNKTQIPKFKMYTQTFGIHKTIIKNNMKKKAIHKRQSVKSRMNELKQFVKSHRKLVA